MSMRRPSRSRKGQGLHIHHHNLSRIRRSLHKVHRKLEQVLHNPVLRMQVLHNREPHTA